MTRFLKKHLAFFPALFLLSCLVLTNPLATHHQMRNLEPYPDGIYYTVGAQNILKGEGFTLKYQESQIKPKIPFAYSVVVSPFTLLRGTMPFYTANVFLMVLGCWWLYRALRNVTEYPGIHILGTCLFVLHGYLVWFVTLPMAENAGLCLVALILSRLSQKKMTMSSVVVACCASWLLVFTKYVYAPVSAVAYLWMIVKFIQNREWYLGRALVAVSMVMGVLFGAFLVYIGFNPFAVLDDMTLIDKPETTVFNYSLGGVLTNLTYYGWLLVGKPTRILWLTYPFTSSALSGGVVAASALVWWKKRRLPENFRWIVALGLAPLAMLLFFYYQDGRYLLTVIPCMCLALAMLMDALVTSKSKVWLLVASILILLIHSLSQLSFFKYVVATNIMLRSRAWQYEAAQELVTVVPKTKATYLITALPPYVLDFYDEGSQLPRLLPLAQDQEFLSKKQYIWGDDIDYSNLPYQYQLLLDQGHEVLVTNAYITNTQVSTQAFEDLKTQFSLELVSSGCDQACNVYRLKPRAAPDGKPSQ